MADTRKITIELITKDGSEEEKTEDVPEQPDPDPDDEDNKEKRQKFVKYAAQKGMMLAKQALQTGMDRYFSLTEDYIAQNDIKIITNVISDTKSLFSNVVVGGTMFGPAGAAIGAIEWAGSKIISTVSGYSALRQEINQNNYNMQFQRVRMGLVDNGRGTEN